LFTIKFQWKHKFFWCVATKWHNAHWVFITISLQPSIQCASNV
jgi:hypothetical protein